MCDSSNICRFAGLPREEQRLYPSGHHAGAEEQQSFVCKGTRWYVHQKLSGVLANLQPIVTKLIFVVLGKLYHNFLKIFTLLFKQYM